MNRPPTLGVVSVLPIVIGLILLVAIALATYGLVSRGELLSQIKVLKESLEQANASSESQITELKTELAKLEKIRHIPNIIERSRKLESEIAAKLERASKDAIAAKTAAQEEATRILGEANLKADGYRQGIMAEVASDYSKAKAALRNAEAEANTMVQDAQKKAKELLSQARKDVKEKAQAVEDLLSWATSLSFEIRRSAEIRAREIAGEAFDAKSRHAFYESAAKAMENVVKGYGDTYMVPAEHMIDELAEEYGFHKAAIKLKVARERTRVMQKNGLAATCNYPEGWKRDYAVNFVLSAFNGKVDSILARLKPSNQGKLIQEIKDTYALVNHNGEVFRNARIQPEFLEARLEELKWAVAIQRHKERERDEQRAIREQMREEEKARKEAEKAIREAERQEQAIAKALQKARHEFETASAEDRERYQTQIDELTRQKIEAEERNRRAISLAQQTKVGHVYIISNMGSFGEDVVKIGLTRRCEPLDRVRELGDASVPFPFDVHAMVKADDAPALETLLHRRFLAYQINKVNRRKEFFRVKLSEIRSVLEEMGFNVHWTMAAEARDYRESLLIEKRMAEDPNFRESWVASESTYTADPTSDQEDEDATAEDIYDVSYAPNQ